jgi:hypothetical protein
VQALNRWRSRRIVVTRAFAIWWASLGYYQPAEHWIPEALLVKEHRAQSIKVPKLIIVSGSNALFGIDSPTLERFIGRPVVNLATHASLPLEFHAAEVLKFAGPGDIVLMPLEYEYYASDDSVTSWHVRNLSTWGNDFLKASLWRSISYFRHSALADVIDRLYARQPIPVDPQAVVLSTAAANSSGIFPTWAGYSYRSINSYGDFISGGGAHNQTNPPYLVSLPTEFALDILRNLQRSLALRGAKLELTWPVSIRSETFDISSERDHASVEHLRQALTKAGLTVICKDDAFQLNPSLFLNTRYHTDEKGTQYRTAALASCLSGNKIDPQELYKSREITAKNAALAVRDQAISDLSLIVDALRSYRRENGTYPASPSWTGFASANGQVGPDWIRGLAPRYIPEVPRDRRMSNVTDHQYLYRSDGIDFKLLAHGREDCELFRSIRPDMIDRKRDCIAVGFWTADARDW